MPRLAVRLHKSASAFLDTVKESPSGSRRERTVPMHGP